MYELLTEAAPYLQLLNLFVFPAIWWAATITGKVDRLHKGFATLQSLRAKVTVLEERTGGAIAITPE